MKVGLAFTSMNRQRVLDETLAAVKTHTPADFPVVVVDDGSNPPLQVPDWVKLVRHETRQGIPAAKNRCLSELYDLGVEHFFLWDDDTRPAADEWWVPYAEGAEPHYQYSWSHFVDDHAVSKMTQVYQDSTLVAYQWSMGCLLYAHRLMIDRVGGMNLAFGMGYEEHAEWSNRAHNAGLTTFIHQDHPDMKGRVWAGDEQCTVTRSFTNTDIRALVDRNTALRESLIDSTDFVEFRCYKPALTRNVVLTCYFTGQMDEQRGIHLPADSKAFGDLARSVGRQLVVLHDCFPNGLIIEHQLVEAPLCAYTQRWISEWRWLRDHPEVEYVWLVDATDTELLYDPWPHMQPGILYCGWEPTIVGCDWIRKHCPDGLQGWVNEHNDEMLLNTGIVGGDRDTVMRLCHRMIDLWAASDRRDPLYEMTLFQIAAREQTVKTGPRIATLFKANQRTNFSMWRHK